MHPLIAALVVEQEREGLSDVRLAGKLGVPPSTISRLKRGLLGPGRRVQDRILAVYPALVGFVLPVAGGVAGRCEVAEVSHGPPTTA